MRGGFRKGSGRKRMPNDYVPPPSGKCVYVPMWMLEAVKEFMKSLKLKKER